MEIDGSVGYGQVLRTAISLAALTLKPVKITNIRKDRPKPGLMPQHLMGVKIAGEFCDAEIKGLKIGSTEVEFFPKKHNFSDRKIDIGTAGQISLLLQTLTPLLAFADREINLEIKGGTAGLGAPTIDYLKHVTYPLLSKMGLKIPNIEIIRHGFYPKGQGSVKVNFYPSKQLKSIEMMDKGNLKSLHCVSIAGFLPKHIADRQAKSARDCLSSNFNKDVEVESIYTETSSPGTCITCWAKYENTIIGSDDIGKLGVTSEIIGEECAKELVASIDSGACLDKWVSDQMLVYMALAGGRSKVRIEEFTDHVKSKIKIIESMLNVHFDANHENKTVSVEGIGFKVD